MDIKIPSPSAFFSSPNPPQSAAATIVPSKAARKRNSISNAATKKAAAAAAATAPAASAKDAGTSADKLPAAKPKQKKSRNGCITCKEKRVKCDEMKPTCKQCKDRNVTCGGYNKDFKWRLYQEQSFSTKPIPAPAKPKKDVASPSSSFDPLYSVSSSPEVYRTARLAQSLPSGQDASRMQGYGPDMSFAGLSPPSMFASPPGGNQFPGSGPISIPSPTASLPLRPQENARIGSPRSHTSGRSPTLSELLSPGSILNAPFDTSLSTGQMFASPGSGTVTMQSPPTRNVDIMQEDSVLGPLDEEDEADETIIRSDSDSFSQMSPFTFTPPHSSPDPGGLSLLFNPPSPISSFAASPGSFEFYMINPPMIRNPALDPTSPEMLMLLYDKQTCGVLSVKDGPSENHWRGLWKLATAVPALYHGILAMTAFHASKHLPTNEVGRYHLGRSLRALIDGIQGDIGIEAALATALVLAFSDSWHQHISSGIQHRVGARALVQQVMNTATRAAANAKTPTTSPVPDLNNERIRFLCNSWVYMDVMARMTTLDEGDTVDLEQLVTTIGAPNSTTTDVSNEVDPLLGCAATLFPLIGKVANLVQTVRRTTANSPALIAQAAELKTQIEEWAPPAVFDTPEDPTSQIQHNLQTAEAYRVSTLLCIHQAVPEIPSETASDLANTVLKHLATVPMSSRTTISHIFPLFVASCEVSTEDDREFVKQRWSAMQARLMLGNIDRCVEIIQEVWSRRDSHALLKAAAAPGPASAAGTSSSTRNINSMMDHMEGLDGMGLNMGMNMNMGIGGMGDAFRRPSLPKRKPSDSMENLDPEMTVRGRLHWVGVMRDWNWEVLLG